MGKYLNSSKCTKCTFRQQREEIMRKQEKLDVILKKKSQIRPESPGTRRRKLKRNNSLPLRRSNSKINEVSSFFGCCGYNAFDTGLGQFYFIDEVDRPNLCSFLRMIYFAFLGTFVLNMFEVLHLFHVWRLSLSHSCSIKNSKLYRSVKVLQIFCMLL